MSKRSDANPRPHDLISHHKNQSQLEHYLIKNLEVENISDFFLTLNLIQRVRRGLAPSAIKEIDHTIPSNQITLSQQEQLILNQRLSPSSFKTIAKISRTLGRESYNNVMLLGKAGVGKTFTLDQLISVFSFGVVPDDIKPQLGYVDDDDTSASDFAKEFSKNYFRNLRFFLINDTLLSLDNTKSGKAFAKAEQRVKAIISDLFNHAHEDFLKSGVRTVFVFEEIATLPPYIHGTLKSLLDKTGFKDPNDPLSRGSDFGVSIIGITTPDEYRQMVNGDAAIARRFVEIFIEEPSEVEAVEILKGIRDKEQSRFGLQISDTILSYLVSMRILFNNPPQAMPASVINGLKNLMSWIGNPENRMQTSHPLSYEVTLQDAYRFMIDSANLPSSTWLPKNENGKELPPLYKLEDKIRPYLVGQLVTEKNGIVDRLVRRLKTGRSTGFREVPVFIIMGPSGSGKGTIAKAVNKEMFGHNGSHLHYSLAGSAANQFTAIFDGGSVGSSSSDEMPLLVQALENGPRHGVIVLDEAKDLPSEMFDRLKVIVEEGEIKPKGRDSRSRPLGVNPIFIMGQWGEELFEGLNDQQILERMAQLSESDLIKILKAGKDNGRQGAVPHALIQRAIKSGGIFLMPPVEKNNYVGIIQANTAIIIGNYKSRSNTTLVIDKSLEDVILKVAFALNRDTRGVGGLTSSLIETPISESMDQGIETTNVTLRLSSPNPSETKLSKIKIKLEIISGKMSPRSIEWELNDLLTTRIDQNCESHI